LQESGGRGEKYHHADGYKEFTHAASEGEFTLLSAYPILSSSLINCSSSESPPRLTTVAARFEVGWNGKLIVYSVHMPTHRGMLYSERTGGFLSGILGIPGTLWAKKRALREVYWNSQLEMANQLAARIRSESAPVIVVGDFNAPPFGPFYRTFDSFLEDGHKRAGSGFGYSFPGETRNPIAFGGPWLRLDYIFCSPSHLRTIRHITETNRSSQHLAVFAELEANHGS
jgi:endonuclease/exonuclease/phosphatase family metal-dependent hydrolase